MFKVKNIQEYLKDLVYVDGKASIEAIETKMKAHGVSYIPIILANRTNKAVVSRKKLLSWMLANEGEYPTVEEIQDDALPEVELDTNLDEAMKLLSTSSAVLVKEGGKIKYYISPRVIANALQAYSEKFRLIEECEQLIRELLENNTLIEEREKALENNPYRTPGVDLTGDLKRMQFSDYAYCFRELWVYLPLKRIDKNTFLDLLKSANEFRNKVMHFRLEDTQDSSDVLSLIRLIKL